MTDSPETPKTLRTLKPREVPAPVPMPTNVDTSNSFEMIAKTFFGLEGVLAEELTELGALDVRLGRRMCTFRGDQKLMYRANVACRTAVRILKPIASFPVPNVDALYRGVNRIDWTRLMNPEGTLAIDPVVRSEVFRHSVYAAQVAKDGVVDQIRNRTRRRPSVDLANPDLRINLHIDARKATIYLDSSGDSLHKRGYRTMSGEAPINEVLAAGILRLTGWDQQSPFVDFMCGSGTFPIEAAMLARRVYPGLIRKQFGFMRWRDFSQNLLADVLREAKRAQLPSLPFPIHGSDNDIEMINAARDNARRAGVEQTVQWRAQDFSRVLQPAASGTVVTNPPYEERLKTTQIFDFYRRIGDVLKQRWAGYNAFVLTGNREAAKHIGLRPSSRTPLFNGPIECRLLKFAMYASETQQVEPDEDLDEAGQLLGPSSQGLDEAGELPEDVS